MCIKKNPITPAKTENIAIKLESSIFMLNVLIFLNKYWITIKFCL